MSDPLSSDILEEQFGPTVVKVLAQDVDRRVISTLAGGQALEFSMVTFSRGAAAAYPEVRRDISGGMSMGKAFRGRGIPFERRTRAVYSYDLRGGFRGRFGADGPATVVEVSVLAGKDAMPYADILEVYAPGVDWPEPGTSPTPRLKTRLDSFDKLLTELGH
ncbi:MAG TPA: hypothetical protein VFX84_00325 [Candidatus Saccharimonadales bacterium]|nr:hypothetical protein [Candidatus Saccharimonadales bacterium]